MHRSSMITITFFPSRDRVKEGDGFSLSCSATISSAAASARISRMFPALRTHMPKHAAASSAASAAFLFLQRKTVSPEMARITPRFNSHAEGRMVRGSSYFSPGERFP